MKKIMIALSLALMFCCVACGDNGNTKETVEVKLDKEIHEIGFSYYVSSDWDVSIKAGKKYYYIEDATMYPQSSDNNLEVSDLTIDDMIDGIASGLDNGKKGDYEKITVDNTNAYRVQITGVLNELDYKMDIVIFAIPHGVGSIVIGAEQKTDTDISNILSLVIDTIKITKEEKKESSENSTNITVNESTTETTKAATLGEINALKTAKSYLRSSSFSYSGLIKQLEYEGFTAEESTYGADNCGADWKEQAAKEAAAYLRSSSFSRSGLIDQLKYEGFTDEEAEYGVTSVGY